MKRYTDYSILGTYTLKINKNKAELIGDMNIKAVDFNGMEELMDFLALESCINICKRDGEIKITFDKNHELKQIHNVL